MKAYVWVTYLEMVTPVTVTLPLPSNMQLTKEIMRYPEYMALYRAVGGPLGWDTRLKMSQPDLETLLQQPKSANYVLRAGGEAIGFCEFERGDDGVVEVKHFGLAPAFYGRGLGLPLLQNALAAEWGNGPKRIWLHTDECDHPAAVHTYQKAGFQIFDRRYEDAEPL